MLEKLFKAFRESTKRKTKFKDLKKVALNIFLFKMISPELCIKCKGKLLCGLSACPVLQKYNAFNKISTSINGTKFEGNSPPSIFVTWNNYPNITIAPLSPATILNNSELLDRPEKWFGIPLTEIVSMRQQLIQSKKTINANSASNPSYELSEMQEIAMSSKPVTIDVELLKRPSLNVSFHESIAPMGPIGQLKEMSLVENPKISKKIEYLTSDTAVKSTIALQELYKSGTEISTIQKILSAGVLGVKKNRKLVPTRWAITAVDDSIGKNLIEKIKEFTQISEVQLFHSNYLDNNFYILLIPRVWSFEMLECWLPGGVWTQNTTQYHIGADYEFFEGRKNYASNVEGAYYAARLGIAEHLIKEKRQASAIVFREVGEGYALAMGVWVIRETIRKAFDKKPVLFSDLNLASSYLDRRLKVPFKEWKSKSMLIDDLLHQKKLSDFA